MVLASKKKLNNIPVENIALRVTRKMLSSPLGLQTPVWGPLLKWVTRIARIASTLALHKKKDRRSADSV